MSFARRPPHAAAALLAGLMVIATLAFAQKAENLLQSGIKKETVDGNLRGAIEDYKKAAAEAKSDRSLAARALFQLAQCYRKLGDAQAKQTLERIVREFGDQPFAAQARTQLAALTPVPEGGEMSLRKVDESGEYGCSSISADGTLAGCALGEIREAAVLEIATGRFRNLTQLRKEGPAQRVLSTYAISPDGKWMAMHLYRDGAVQNELAIIPTDGAGTLKTLYKHPEDRWLDIHTWTPDSKSVLFTLRAKAGTAERPTLHTITIADRALHPIRPVEFDTEWVPMSYSPDGRWLAISVPSHGSQRTFDVEIWNPADGRLASSVIQSELNDVVAGWSPDGSSLIVSNSQDGKTSLHRIPITDGKPSGPARPIRASVDQLRDVKGIDQKGRMLYSVGRVEINVYSTEFDPHRGSVSGTGRRYSTQHPDRQAFGAWSPDGKRFAYWTFDRFENTESATQPQVIVRDLQSGAETIARPEKGFHANRIPAWSSDSRTLLMLTLEGQPNLYSLSRLDPVTGKVTVLSKPVRVTNVGYTPDWTPDARWMFQRRDAGEVYRIDVATGEETLIYRSDRGHIRGQQISPDGTRLVFAGGNRNKPTLEVLELPSGAMRSIPLPVAVGWGASVIAWTPDSRFLVYGSSDGNQSDIWIVPQDGSAPPGKLLPDLMGRASQFAFSPDGKTLTYIRTTAARELWTLAGFLREGQ